MRKRADIFLYREFMTKKWENATTTKKAITETITERVDHVEKDLGIIRSMGSEFEDKGIEKYKATLELSDAIEVMNQYQKQKEEILRRQEEEAKEKPKRKHVRHQRLVLLLILRCRKHQLRRLYRKKNY